MMDILNTPIYQDTAAFWFSIALVVFFVILSFVVTALLISLAVDRIRALFRAIRLGLDR